MDANVLISAAFGGVPASAVKKAFEQEVWTSEEIQRELLEIQRYFPKVFSQEQVLTWNSALLPLLSKMRLSEVRHRLKLSRDPKDDMYLSLARAVLADFLVTGDKDLLSISAEKLAHSGLEHLQIVTPKEFLGA